ncbi:MAG: glutamate racemase [Clostridia bacterium]|nr:glutamate racemase [Clostridia bacterium]
MIDREKPIGVFDSGVGGVSVLRELVRIAPFENIIYYGDSANAPYGDKSTEEVRELAFAAFNKLISMGAKAIVVACNTATGASVRLLREQYPDIPIVGIEPAIKPAVIYGETVLGKSDGSSKVLVMATPVTISQSKFAHLTEEYDKRANIIPLPCPRLAELIEAGDPNSIEVENYLKELLAPYKDVDSVVLGCTHYPFSASLIGELLPGVKIFDGGLGTAKEALRRIEAAGLKNENKTEGSISFISSKNEESTELYKKFFYM